MTQTNFDDLFSMPDKEVDQSNFYAKEELRPCKKK